MYLLTRPVYKVTDWREFALDVTGAPVAPPVRPPPAGKPNLKIVDFKYPGEVRAEGRFEVRVRVKNEGESGWGFADVKDAATGRSILEVYKAMIHPTPPGLPFRVNKGEVKDLTLPCRARRSKGRWKLRLEVGYAALPLYPIPLTKKPVAPKGVVFTAPKVVRIALGGLAPAAKRAR